MNGMSRKKGYNHKLRRSAKRRGTRVSEPVSRIGSHAGRKSIIRGKNTAQADIRTIGKAGTDYIAF